VHNAPRVFASIREIARDLRTLRADILCCSGYKPDVIGWRAARRAGIPVVSISHGWTAATWRVRCYEKLDRCILKQMDMVVCVSNAQAERVRAAGVPVSKMVIIRNGIGAEAFVEPNAARRDEMASWFAERPRWIVGAAGRMSPEKGFADLIDAASEVLKQRPGAGFVLFGSGPLEDDLKRRVAECGIQEKFVFAGFRSDLNRFLGSLDVNVMSSYTEGLPVVLLEAGAAGVPTVATAVGGIPEVIADGQNGYLVRAGDSSALAQRILAMIDDDAKRKAMGAAARDKVRRDFSFTAMSQQYQELFRKLVANPKSVGEPAGS
jgi:glycosyltransferase involved in cell wall biosynthesis